MKGLTIELVGMTHLDHLPRVHHRGVVGKFTTGGNVVGNEDEAGLCFAFDRLQHVHDVRLSEHIQRRRRLIENHHIRHGNQGHRQGRALAHASAELEGVAVEKIHWHPNPMEDLLSRPAGGRQALRPPMGEQRFRHLVSDPDHWIQRIHGALRNPGQPDPPHLLPKLFFRERHHIQTIQPNASAVASHVSGQETQDGTRQRTLAAAALANDHHRPPPRQGQADPVHCLHRALACAEVQPQVINGEKAVCGHHTSRSLGLTTRSRANPNMVNPSPLTISSAAGSSTQ